MTVLKNSSILAKYCNSQVNNLLYSKNACLDLGPCILVLAKMNVHLWSFLESSRDPLVALCPDFCCFLYFRICNSKSILKGRTFFLWQPQEGKFSNKWMMAVPEVIQTYNSILSWWWINFTLTQDDKFKFKNPRTQIVFRFRPQKFTKKYQFKRRFCQKIVNYIFESWRLNISNAKLHDFSCNTAFYQTLSVNHLQVLPKRMLP